MKKISNLKKVLVIALMVGIVFITTNVFADDNNSGFSDLSSTLNNSSTNTSSNTSNLSSNTSNLSTTGNTSTNLTTNTANTADSTNLTNTTSLYNSSNLPKTGIENSFPMGVLVVVLAISAVYAYKKVRDYQNL